MPVPDGDLDRAALDGVAAAFHAEHRGLYGYDFAGDPSQQVEWVNLRVSGIGPITRPEIRRRFAGSTASQARQERSARRATRVRGRSASTPTRGTSTPPSAGAPT